MMRHVLIASALVLAIAGGMGAVQGDARAAEIKSLRGDVPLDAPPKPPRKARVMTQTGGFARQWKQQPPLIPHKIDKERISLDENSCFRCHSPDTYKSENAPMISRTHFKDPENPSDANLIRARWFCNQCHVPQVDAPPLVENRFRSASR